ncbi:hypothetical protein [Methylopila sp. 73B]|uniref:glycine-rich domain-containing protein n=1 Tax=Methylopila sp. 73B TaxID=1120792 RepID=UPI0003A9CBDF|nr:hypothetical protein [Methylopila sp. 73B]
MSSVYITEEPRPLVEVVEEVVTVTVLAGGPPGPRGAKGDPGEPGHDGPSDHGLLDGLGDDDHPQYLTAGRGDARYAPTVHTHVSTDIADFNAAVDVRAALKVDALVGSAPGSLDTLQEIADALGDDPNFAGTIIGQLGGKVGKADVTGVLKGDGTTVSAAPVTGTGAVVQDNSPTLVTPNIGVATADFLNVVAAVGVIGAINRLNLHATTYGFGISSNRMSAVVPSTAVTAFYSGTTLAGQFGSTGLNNSPIGATTPATGRFTNLTATGTTTLATSLYGALTATAGVVSANPTFEAVVFTASGTFTKSNYPWAKRAYVVVSGGGGGGGSGSIGDATAARVAGAGGAPGVVSDRWFSMDQLPSTVPVTVGAGGSGGPSVTSTGAAVAGVAGSAGNSSSFGDLLNAIGGDPGNGGPVPAATAAAGALRNPGISTAYYTAAGGAAASSGTNGAAGGRSAMGGGGGGAGGGTVSGSGASRAGGQGGGIHALASGITAVGGGGAAGAVGSSYMGGDGASHTGANDPYFGEGGGGGTSNSAGLPGHGGNGGAPSGGGGGGAATVYPGGTSTGAGGSGARGEVVVFLYA